MLPNSLPIVSLFWQLVTNLQALKIYFSLPCSRLMTIYLLCTQKRSTPNRKLECSPWSIVIGREMAFRGWTVRNLDRYGKMGHQFPSAISIF